MENYKIFQKHLSSKIKTVCQKLKKNLIKTFKKEKL